MTLKRLKNKKFSIPRIELKDKSEWVEEIKFNIPVEILKFLLLSILLVAFVLLQYQNKINLDEQYQFFRQIYVYSFGLAFGDLSILIIIGCFASLVIWWITPVMKKYYFSWFQKHTRVDYWLIRKNLIIFIWLNIIVISVIYYLMLAQKRHSNWYLLNTNEFSNIFRFGWYYSFTNVPDSHLPNSFLSVGIFLDSILNVFYILSFGPWFIIILLLALNIYIWVRFITLKPRLYFKFMNSKKRTIQTIEKYLKRKDSIFYYTQAVIDYFQFCKECANVLKIYYANCSFNFLLSQIKKNIKLLSEHSITSKYFVYVPKKKRYEYFADELDILRTSELNIEKDEDVIFDGVSSTSLIEYHHSTLGKPLTYTISTITTNSYLVEKEFPTQLYPVDHIFTDEFSPQQPRMIEIKNINRINKNALNAIVDNNDDVKTKEIYNIDLLVLEQKQEELFNTNEVINNNVPKDNIDEQNNNDNFRNHNVLEDHNQEINTEEEWISPILL